MQAPSYSGALHNQFDNVGIAMNSNQPLSNWCKVTPEKNTNVIQLEQYGFTSKSQNGFTTSVLRRANDKPPPCIVDIFSIQNTVRQRLLIVSKSFKTSSKRTRNKPKKTNGKKTGRYASHHEFKGEWFEINADDNQGYYPDILNLVLEQLTFSIEIHRRVFAVRFDLHQKDHYTDNSKMVSQFFDRTKKKLLRHYHGLKSIGYAWVREHERSKAQHYHCVFFLDYDLIKSSYTVGKFIRETWESIREGNTVHIVHETHKISSEQSKRDAIYHLSYLAKERGKGYRPPQSKDYGGSRLKPTL